MNHKVLALCVGTARPFRAQEQSAISKQPVQGTVQIDVLGIAGDQQADKVHHGGPDMAVHHYPLDHHDFWREQMGKHELLDQPGAFGSNLCVRGLTEYHVLLGDRFRLGSALLEASQPRQPCWKIEHRFGRTKMVKAILASRRCGWFYRVIEAGEAKAGDTLQKVENGLDGWSMARIFEAIWGTSTPLDPELLHQITELEPLADKLRAKLRAKLAAN